MAWPATLTTGQQKAVTDFTTSARAWAAQLEQLNVLGASVGAAWFGGINALVGGLQAGDLIPNTSGLAGSQDLTQADVTNLALWAFAHSNPANADQGTGAYASAGIQQTCVKAAGINATIGK
jgi:hypothetical protein